MVARINRIENDDVEPINPNRPKRNYYHASNKTGPFTDPSLLDPIYVDQHEDIREALDFKKTKPVKMDFAKGTVPVWIVFWTTTLECFGHRCLPDHPQNFPTKG